MTVVPSIEDLARDNPGYFDEILSPCAAAAFVHYPEPTLQAWRCAGKGPRFMKFGKRVGYRRRHLIEWIEANTVKTQEEAA